MVKLEVIKKERYIYTLKDEKSKEYILNLEILDMEKGLEVGDNIYISNELLKYSANYTFGNLDNMYGKSNISLNDIDVIKVVKDNEEIYLKRLYG